MYLKKLQPKLKKKTQQQGIQELKTQLEIEQPGDISPEPQPEQDHGEIETISTRVVSFIDKLTEEAIKVIRQFELIKPTDYRVFGDFAVQSYYSIKEFLKDEYKNSRISREEWADWLFKTNKGIGRLNIRALGYREFRRGIDEYDNTRRTSNNWQRIFKCEIL